MEIGTAAMNEKLPKGQLFSLGEITPILMFRLRYYFFIPSVSYGMKK